MPRIPRVPGPPKPPEAGEAILASLGPPKLARKRNARTASAAKRQMQEATEQLDAVLNEEREGWPRHLVALYARLHLSVYEVVAEELAQPNDWSGACSAADKLLRDVFGGDFSAALHFMQWVWRRELKNEKWRRENDKPPYRVDWRKQFVHRFLVTDYRHAMRREQRREARA